MGTVVNDLVTKFSFEGSIGPLDDYNESLTGSVALLGGMLIALNASAAAFAFWADGVLTGVDSLSALSKQTDVSVAKIQELNFAAEQTQSSAAAVESTIRGLTGTIGTAAQKGSEDFSRLGISVRDANGNIKNADVILDEVSQRFQTLGLSMKEQEHFASALGIDTSLLQLMNKTSSEMGAMRDRARELGVLTAEQTEQAAMYKQSLNAMWFGLNSVKQLIAIGVAPELSRMAENFTQLLADNKDWIVEGIQFSVEWIGNFIAAFNRLLPVFALIGAGFLLMKISALGFGAAMGLVFSPVVLITAGIIAMLAIIDDLIVAFSGGESVIASFFQNAFDFDIVEAMISTLETLKQSLSGVAGFFGFGVDAGSSVNTQQAAIPQGAFSDVPTLPGADNRQVNQTNTIQINTNDPEAAGRAVENSLQRQLDNANTQLAPGGR